MKLIVGLGNPGAEYEKTRHNFGWRILDFLATEFGADKWQSKKKFRAEIAETEINGEKVLFAKPQTFYNLSGESIRGLRDFYNLENSDILAIHDDLALPIGAMRTRIGGGDGGNNGVKSMVQHLGADFARLRIGSGSEPAENGNTRPIGEHKNHVLSRPNAEEKEILEQFMPQIQQIVNNFANGKFAETTYSGSR